MAAPGERDIYSVSRLNNAVRDLLEGGFPLLWVSGEVSNLSRPGSGHLYFSLKDAASQVRCAMFRTHNRLLGFVPENGGQVVARARVSLYVPRGDFQLIVEYMEPYGAGDLRLAFEELKRRLAAEGLFDMARKRPPPALPRRIGVVSSPSGAAIHDILSVLQRRFPAIPVLIYPVPVQGAGAAQRIAQALALAGERAECDVLILARGGGSLEDLWPFNEEVVARAIHACPIPVVTGIGHEVDFTIADFVADLRAPTPSAAAAAVSPDQAEWRGRVNGLAARLGYLLGDRLQRHRQRLGWLTRGLRHPQRRLLDLAQRLDGLALRLARAQRGLLAARALRLQQAATRLHRAEPRVRLARAAGRLGALEQRLAGAWRQGLDSRRARLATLGRGLEAVSPMATLGRGYAILTRAADGVLVRCVSQIRAGDRLSARVTDGSIPCTVEARDTGPTPAGSG